MGKISNIMGGWKNVVFKDPEVEKLAKERAKICDTCDYASEDNDSFFDLEKDKLVTYKGYCKKCLCPFKAKLRSVNEKCPINKW